jgi:hypothetical protein
MGWSGAWQVLQVDLRILCASVAASLRSTDHLSRISKPGAGCAAGRIYFIRHPSVLSRLGAPDVKVDGKLVGELAVGTYIAADRPAGPHMITVVGAMDSVGCEAEIRVQPGMSYYFEMGPIVRTNMDEFNIASMGVTGQPVPCRNRHNTPYMFYSLDATAGTAAVARLKARN